MFPYFVEKTKICNYVFLRKKKVVVIIIYCVIEKLKYYLKFIYARKVILWLQKSKLNK